MSDLVEIYLPNGTGHGGTLTVNGVDMSKMVCGATMSVGLKDATAVRLHLIATPLIFKGQADVLVYHECPDCPGHGVGRIVEPKEGS